VKASDLRAVWEAPDNTRLMKKQTSVRLATHIGARISALCDIFPSKSKSQLINDLLAAALQVFENSFEFVPGRDAAQDPYTDEILYEDQGHRVGFLNRANRYLEEYEAEIGNDEPKLFNAVWTSTKE